MIISFVSAEGKKIQYDTGGSIVTQENVCSIADLYAQLHPDRLPTHVYMRADVYRDFSMTQRHTLMAYSEGQPCLLVATGCGLLIAKALPYGFDKFLLMVGTKADYDHYFLDEVFEETVLKDCERT